MEVTKWRCRLNIFFSCLVIKMLNYLIFYRPWPTGIKGPQGSSMYEIYSCLCFAWWSHQITFIMPTKVFLNINNSKEANCLLKSGWFQMSTFNSTRSTSKHLSNDKTQRENRTEQKIVTQSNQNKPNKVCTGTFLLFISHSCLTLKFNWINVTQLTYTVDRIT